MQRVLKRCLAETVLPIYAHPPHLPRQHRRGFSCVRAHLPTPFGTYRTAAGAAQRWYARDHLMGLMLALAQYISDVSTSPHARSAGNGY